MSVAQHELHRTAKYFMDDGRAATAEDALCMLAGFGLNVSIDAAAAGTLNGQIALLTLVNAARRTMLGGVEVLGAGDQRCVTRLASESSLAGAVTTLGGRRVAHLRRDWPTVVIGDESRAHGGPPTLLLHWAGWRGGVVPAGATARRDAEAMPLAPAMAAAAAIGEVFSWHAGDHPMAGRRASGLSIWRPGSSWLCDDDEEPPLRFLPSRLWLIGLGNLGQAFSWLLAALPYPERSHVELTLQDFDRMAPSNDSTSLLARPDQPPTLKTRWVSDWLESRGFETMLVERRFGAQTRRNGAEPTAALCGVDNALARSALEEAGFDLVVEAGLGAGPQGFKTFSLHTFPGALSASKLWGSVTSTSADMSHMAAYQDLKSKGMDRCGLTQLASRTIGVPYVGLTAAVLAVGELLRRLHSAPATDVISGSLDALDDLERCAGTAQPYGHGHIHIESLTV